MMKGKMRTQQEKVRLLKALIENNRERVAGFREDGPDAFARGMGEGSAAAYRFVLDMVEEGSF